MREVLPKVPGGAEATLVRKPPLATIVSCGQDAVEPCANRILGSRLHEILTVGGKERRRDVFVLHPLGHSPAADVDVGFR